MNCSSLLSILLALSAASALGEPLPIPANTSYGDPDINSGRRTKDGKLDRWSDPAQHVLWFGELKHPGNLAVRIKAAPPEGNTADFQIKVNPVAGGKGFTGPITKMAAAGTLELGIFKIEQPGYYQFALSGLFKNGGSFGSIEALELEGPAAAEAHFSLVERRNAASVHMAYEQPKDSETAWFYNEVTVREDPIHSFFMACGFHRGYFGIQVNSPKERRIIFSVWDSGKEGKDRARVADENRVRLLAKGDGVDAGDFGNEGTGGHSHLVYPWKRGETYHFLLGARPDGDGTIYSAYFYFPEKSAWSLIASFRAPKDGGYLHGLHSFNENFVGSNGHLLRLAEYGPQWIAGAGGAWKELTRASFSHDEHGKENRLDYTMGPKGTRFYLSNGGWLAEPVKYGQKFDRASSGAEPPPLALAGLKAAKP